MQATAKQCTLQNGRHHTPARQHASSQLATTAAARHGTSAGAPALPAAVQRQLEHRGQVCPAALQCAAPVWLDCVLWEAPQRRSAKRHSSEHGRWQPVQLQANRSRLRQPAPPRLQASQRLLHLAEPLETPQHQLQQQRLLLALAVATTLPSQQLCDAAASPLAAGVSSACAMPLPSKKLALRAHTLQWVHTATVCCRLQCLLTAASP